MFLMRLLAANFFPDTRSPELDDRLSETVELIQNQNNKIINKSFPGELPAQPLQLVPDIEVDAKRNKKLDACKANPIQQK